MENWDEGGIGMNNRIEIREVITRRNRWVVYSRVKKSQSDGDYKINVNLRVIWIIKVMIEVSVMRNSWGVLAARDLLLLLLLLLLLTVSL